MRPRAGRRGAAHLEHVAEVGGELQDAAAPAPASRPKLTQAHPLVEAVLPEQAGALDVDDALPASTGPPSGGSGRLVRWAVKSDVVLADRAPEQRQRPCRRCSGGSRDRSRVSSWNRPSPSPMDVAVAVGRRRSVSPCFSDEQALSLPRGSRGSSGSTAAPTFNRPARAGRGAVADRARPAYSRQ